jgi:hypothetical protein
MFRLHLGLAVIAALALSGCVWPNEPPRAIPKSVCSHIQDVQDKVTCESKVDAAVQGGTVPSERSGIPVRSTIPLSGLLSWWALYYAFGLVIARAVFVDARRREWTVLQIRPLWWAVMCVVDVILGVLVYWVVHYSRLAPRFAGSNNSLERSREE